MELNIESEKKDAIAGLLAADGAFIVLYRDKDGANFKMNFSGSYEGMIFMLDRAHQKLMEAIDSL